MTLLHLDLVAVEPQQDSQNVYQGGRGKMNLGHCYLAPFHQALGVDLGTGELERDI